MGEIQMSAMWQSRYQSVKVFLRIFLAQVIWWISVAFLVGTFLCLVHNWIQNTPTKIFGALLLSMAPAIPWMLIVSFKEQSSSPKPEPEPLTIQRIVKSISYYTWPVQATLFYVTVFW